VGGKRGAGWQNVEQMGLLGEKRFRKGVVVEGKSRSARTTVSPTKRDVGCPG